MRHIDSVRVDCNPSPPSGRQLSPMREPKRYPSSHLTPVHVEQSRNEVETDYLLVMQRRFQDPVVA